MRQRLGRAVALAMALGWALPGAGQGNANTGRAMTAHDLVTLARVGVPIASPDGQMLVWQQTETDPASFVRTTRLWQASTKGGPAQRLPGLGHASQSSPAFSADGRQLYFLSGKSGSSQLWRLDLTQNGAEPEQASRFGADVAGFLLSPNGRRIVVWGEVARGCAGLNCADKPHAAIGNGRLYDDGAGLIRHWDSWAVPGVFTRAFAYGLDGAGAITGEGVALDGAAGSTGALTADIPGKPDGGAEALSWSADSQSLFFAARQAGRGEPTSTNLDIWQSRLDGKAPVNLTSGNLATDALPAASPDGKWLAYGAMARAGYESDRMVVHLRNLATGTVRALTASWDRAAASLTWSPDSRQLIVTADERLDHPAFRIDLSSGKIERLGLAPKRHSEGHIAIGQQLADGTLIYGRDTIASPAEIWLAKPGQAPRQISHANDAALAPLAPISSTRFTFAGAGGDGVWGQIHKPAAKSGPLPVLLFIHGGPQGSFGDGWSYRWNPRLFAGRGYAVVSIDFHGSTGYGQAFTDSINRDWGGKPLVDLQKGLAAALARDPQLDGKRVCALGPSYGGFMVNWIAGNWPDRFSCLVQHNGVFDARAMAYETDELWFDEWEHGGKPYHEDPAEYEKWNPALHVGKWQTPMLVITSEKDFRIPYTQGIASYTALQRRGVPSQLLVFPDENHWVLGARNSLQWHQTVFTWLDRWLKKQD